MNGNSMVVLEEIAQQSGAVVKCGICGSNYVHAGDDDAERRAYGMATNAWKRGEIRSFEVSEVTAAMKSVIDSANIRCPSCC